MTHHNDELARRRQTLSWICIDKNYRFEAKNGSALLTGLSDGRSQLLVYHFMLGSDYKTDCPPCSVVVDGFDSFITHLTNHDMALMMVSHGPLAKLLGYRERMSWNFPWVSSAGSDFNYDFNVSITEDQQRAGNTDYNYVCGDRVMDASDLPEPVQQFASICGADTSTYVHDRPDMSALILGDGIIYHTHFTYTRGFDGLQDVYQ